MRFKNFEGKPEKKSSKRTIFASGGLGLLHSAFSINSFSSQLLINTRVSKAMVNAPNKKDRRREINVPAVD